MTCFKQLDCRELDLYNSGIFANIVFTFHLHKCEMSILKIVNMSAETTAATTTNNNDKQWYESQISETSSSSSSSSFTNLNQGLSAGFNLDEKYPSHWTSSPNKA